ncbi:MAG: GAF domain-containing protein [Candidatus Sumerlaeaceae bacterium]|nr:GAF domain-containing protein [Candidatus Sumerlaeaceae bacterium]
MWFDKKSWRLRRKIKDLQADLREAEKEGRYILQDGLFFAELEDMGEMTMLVFGSTDILSVQEESVIRNFFERNGFTVHKLKIDKTQSHLADVEIIPPSEMIRHIARRLKVNGFKVLDDTNKETPSDVASHIVTLSGLIRSVLVHFCDRVRATIATTHIKMNKEGNRLLHWMPKISEAVRLKVSNDLLAILQPLFEEAYLEFYGHLGSSTRGAAPPLTSDSATDRIPSVRFSPEMAAPPPPSAVPTPPPPSQPVQSFPKSQTQKEPSPPVEEKIRLAPIKTADTVKAAPPQAASESDRVEIERVLKELDTAETLARMYKRLIRASTSRCIRNAQGLLEEANKLFRASAACILVKVPHAHGITIHAQAGKPLVWGEGGKEGFPVSTSVVAEVIRSRRAVKSDQASTPATESMILHRIEAVAAAPIFFNGEIVGILYVDRREGLHPFDKNDLRALEKLAKVFEEFPDLTLGLV